MLQRVLWIASFALPATAVVAHHGVAAYDMAVVQTADGVVDEWRWQTPHTELTLRLGASAEALRIEGAPPRWMEGQGWTPGSLATGETVTVTYHPARRAGGAYAAILMQVRRADGQVLKVNRPRAWAGRNP
jgi:hypothetical protein